MNTSRTKSIMCLSSRRSLQLSLMEFFALNKSLRHEMKNMGIVFVEKSSRLVGLSRVKANVSNHLGAMIPYSCWYPRVINHSRATSSVMTSSSTSSTIGPL